MNRPQKNLFQKIPKFEQRGKKLSDYKPKKFDLLRKLRLFLAYEKMERQLFNRFLRIVSVIDRYVIKATDTRI